MKSTIKEIPATERIPKAVKEANYTTLSVNKYDLAREIFSLRATDIASKYKTVREMMESLDWIELETDIVVMTNVKFFREQLINWGERNLKYLGADKSDWEFKF